MFIKNLGTGTGKITCTPNNEEKSFHFPQDIDVYNYTDKKTGEDVYMTHELRFTYSFKFMASGMDKLVSNITACGKCESCHPGDCLKQYVGEGSIELCDNCRNCLLIKEPCFEPSSEHLRETTKMIVLKG